MSLDNVKEQKFQQEYDKAFGSELLKKIEIIFSQFNEKQPLVYQIFVFGFLLTVLIKSDYLIQFFGNWITTFFNIFHIFYLILILYFLYAVHYPYKNIFLHLFYPKLSIEYKQNKNNINDFFTNEENINNVIACMNYFKKEFKIRFKYDNDPLRDFGDDILKAFKEKNTKKVIKIYFQIKYEIDYFINTQNKELS